MIGAARDGMRMTCAPALPNSRVTTSKADPGGPHVYIHPFLFNFNYRRKAAVGLAMTRRCSYCGPEGRPSKAFTGTSIPRATVGRGPALPGTLSYSCISGARHTKRCDLRRHFGCGFPRFKSRRTRMNSNQVKGTAKDIAGKVQEKVGEITGSTDQQVKGTAKQVEGKLQKGVGDVQQAAKDSVKERKQQG